MCEAEVALQFLLNGGIYEGGLVQTSYPHCVNLQRPNGGEKERRMTPDKTK